MTRLQISRAGSFVTAAAVVVASIGFGAATAAVGTAREGLPSCPVHAKSRLSTNSWGVAERQLAPRGAGNITLCRYVWRHDRYTLAGHDVIRRQQAVHQLVSTFNALKPYHGPEPIRCRGYAGDDVLATLVYHHGREVRVSVRNLQSGCGDATNGDVDRPLFGRKNPAGTRLINELERLTRQ